VLPLVLLLVLEREIVAHHNEVSVLVCVLQSHSQDVSESVETGSSLTLSIVHLKCCGAVEELQEVQSLDNSADSLFLS